MIIEDNGYPGYIWSPELKAVDFINTITKFSAIAAPE
jgi:hypothetical protein